MNVAEMNVAMMEQLSAFVGRYKLEGRYVQRPGDVPCFIPDANGYEVVAHASDAKLDLWYPGGVWPVDFNLTAAQVMKRLTVGTK